jgi:hypothetical protein
LLAQSIFGAKTLPTRISQDSSMKLMHDYMFYKRAKFCPEVFGGVNIRLRVLRRFREWKKINASGQVVGWTRHGV